jgi:acetoin utilization protein AcuB
MSMDPGISSLAPDLPIRDTMDDATLTEVQARLGNENRTALELALSNVGELMARDVVSLRGGQTVQEAITLFGARLFRHILVIDDGRLAGVVSDRDVFRFLAENPQSKDSPVSAVMTRNPITVQREASVASAINLILRKRINCLPVVTEDRTVEGILTTTDLLRALYALQYWLESCPAVAGR